MDYLKIIQHFENSLKTFGRPTLRTATLSTHPMGENEYPSARLVVLREFDPKDMILTVFTHALSKKVEEINRNPQSTLVWYDPDEGLQIQFSCKGKAEIDPKKVDKYIHKLQQHSYKDYFGPKPGTRLSEKQKTILSSSKNISREQIHFCLLHFEIQKITCLRLNPTGNEKCEFYKLKDKIEKNFLAP